MREGSIPSLRMEERRWISASMSMPASGVRAEATPSFSSIPMKRSPPRVLAKAEISFSSSFL
jgi:hypothetical protein